MYIYIYTDKTTLRVIRRLWGGILSNSHQFRIAFTSIPINFTMSSHRFNNDFITISHRGPIDFKTISH